MISQLYFYQHIVHITPTMGYIECGVNRYNISKEHKIIEVPMSMAYLSEIQPSRVESRDH